MSKKTIWITGASSGIGKASAIKFADEGWKVLISARRAELLNELSKILLNKIFMKSTVTNSGLLKLMKITLIRNQ